MGEGAAACVRCGEAIDATYRFCPHCRAPQTGFGAITHDFARLSKGLSLVAFVIAIPSALTLQALVSRAFEASKDALTVWNKLVFTVPLTVGLAIGIYIVWSDAENRWVLSAIVFCVSPFVFAGAGVNVAERTVSTLAAPLRVVSSAAATRPPGTFPGTQPAPPRVPPIRVPPTKAVGLAVLVAAVVWVGWAYFHVYGVWDVASAIVIALFLVWALGVVRARFARQAE